MLRSRAGGTLGAAWGVAGVFATLVVAVARLAPVGLDAFSYPLGWTHWLALAVWVPMMLWSEAYRGFHLSFNPRVAARARYLRAHPTPVRVALAPLFCVGFFHATRRTRVAIFGLTLGITLLVLVVRRLPQPWRGIVDVGVVLGLTAGSVSLVYFCYRAFTAARFDHSPQMPDDAAGSGADR